MGLTSLFLWSVGLSPSKDNYWTTETQPGNPYGIDATEPNWQLQAIVVALSTGPNGPSDMINGTNSSLVMSTVTGDGTLLTPDRPLITLDRALLATYAGPGAEIPNVQSTWSQPSDCPFRWYYVLAANLSAPFTLVGGDVGVYAAGSGGGAVVIDYFSPRSPPLAVLAVPSSVSSVSSSYSTSSSSVSSSYTIPVGMGQPSAPAAAVPIRYLLVAPILPGGYVLIGEAGKVTALSTLRVPSLAVTADGFNATVLGYAREAGVTFLIAYGPGYASTADILCPSGGGLVSSLWCSAAQGGCACASSPPRPAPNPNPPPGWTVSDIVWASLGGLFGAVVVVGVGGSRVGVWARRRRDARTGGGGAAEEEDVAYRAMQTNRRHEREPLTAARV